MSKLKPAAGSSDCHQFGALPYRLSVHGELEVLLITSRASKRWIVPKGWPMKRRSAFEAAAQEAFEEAGVRGRISTQPLGVYRYAKRITDLWILPCAVQLFALEVTKIEAAWREDAERTRAWFSKEDASQRVGEPDLAALIAAFTPALGPESKRAKTVLSPRLAPVF